MFTVGDTVHYAMDGVCRIEDIVVKKVGGTERSYYELHPVYRQSAVIYIPVSDEKQLSRMRRVLTREEIFSAVREIADAKCIWIEQENARREAYQLILKSSDHRQLVSLVKTLYERRAELRDAGRKMRSADLSCLKDAEKLLHEEFAYVLGIRPEEVPGFIQKEIEKQA